MTTFNKTVLKGVSSATNFAYCHTDTSGKEATDGMEEFSKRAIVHWPKSVRTHEELENKLNEIKNLGPMRAGDAYPIYEKVLEIIAKNGGDIKPFVVIKEDEKPKSNPETVKVITRAEVLGNNLIVVGEKIKPVVDTEKFKQQMSVLISSIDRLEILKAVAKNNSEQDFWELIESMLQLPESFVLLGILGARMILPQEIRKDIDLKLKNITVLTNRAGKLSMGVVSLGGFIALACVKDEPLLAHAMKNTKNPLLNQDPLEFRCMKKTGETADAFKTRKTEAEANYNTYRAIIVSMKSHAPQFEKLTKNTKEKIKAEVLRYTVEG